MKYLVSLSYLLPSIAKIGVDLIFKVLRCMDYNKNYIEKETIFVRNCNLLLQREYTMEYLGICHEKS